MTVTDPAPRALIVDDSRTTLRILHDQLAARMPELEIERASNGRQAIELYRDFKPNVVFLDIVMPEMDGYEALRQMRMLGYETTIAMVTATHDDVSLKRALRLGASAFIHKPYSSPEIARVLNVAFSESPPLGVLLVDDSKVQRQFVRTLLEAAVPTAIVEEADDGIHGLRQYLSGLQDIVFIDLNMPRMNGEDLLKEIKSVNEATRVAVVSATTNDALEQRCRDLGADLFLNKPLTPEQLIAGLGTLV